MTTKTTTDLTQTQLVPYTPGHVPGHVAASSAGHRLPLTILRHIFSFIPVRRDRTIKSLVGTQEYYIGRHNLKERASAILDPLQGPTAELCNIVAALRVLPRSIRVSLEEEKTFLIHRIVDDMQILETEKFGRLCIYKCLKKGLYLKTLKAFFVYNPAALQAMLHLYQGQVSVYRKRCQRLIDFQENIAPGAKILRTPPSRSL